MPLSWGFTAHWFASSGGLDRRLTEQRRNRNAVDAGVPLTGVTAWCSSSFTGELHCGGDEHLGHRPGRQKRNRRPCIAVRIVVL